MGRGFEAQNDYNTSQHTSPRNVVESRKGKLKYFRKSKGTPRSQTSFSNTRDDSRLIFEIYRVRRMQQPSFSEDSKNVFSRKRLDDGPFSLPNGFTFSRRSFVLLVLLLF